MACYNALRPNGLQDKRVFAISIYNEALAMAIRAGAPLASYSIDRRCLHDYMTSLTDESTNALMCLLYARRYTHVHGAKQNHIAMRPLLHKDFGAKTAEPSTHVLQRGKTMLSSCLV